MKNLKINALLLLCVMAFFSCNTDDGGSTSGPDDNSFTQNFGTAVNRDFIGQVVDADNNPIQGVTIKIGSSTTQTDVNGVFVINNASVYQKFAYITAKKSGYIDGSRSLVPTTGKNNVKIMMIPFAAQATVQSGEVSEVSIYSGTKVKFDGAFQDENGNDYSGDVQVALFHLTPSDTNISSLMPGMLYAQTENNQEAILETFGMINVELRGSGGQKLNIKSGHTAEITVRIDDAQLATAPNTIPLWHFDEEKGYWKQDGVATKIGNKYVGEVSHFSWWNCDAFSDLVTLNVTVVDSDGNPISNLGVSLYLSSLNSYPQYTDSNGQVSGIIPANQLITLTIKNYCGEIIYTSQIAPSSTNINLPHIIIQDNTQTQSNTIKGILTKCDNSKVTNGYVIINYVDNSMIYNVTNGDFSFNLSKCDINNFTLEGYDLDDFQTSNKLEYRFDNTMTDVGFLPTCTTIDEFIAYKVDDGPIQFIFGNITTYNPFGSNNNANNFIYGSQGESSISIQSSTSQIGSYSLNNNTYIAFYFTKDAGNYSTNYAMTPNTIGVTSKNLNINKFEAVGGYIDVTFSGTVQSSSQTLTLSGVAHVIRDN